MKIVGGPAPGSPEWLRIVTASKVPVILGLAPEGWDTPWTLWHKMTGRAPADDGRNADSKARGHYLEDGIIRWWLDQNPSARGGGTQVWWSVDEWAGATSDLTGVEDADGVPVRFVLNAKTSRSEDHWWSRDDAGYVYRYPPAYYLASIMWEMWCADAQVGYIACLFGGLEFREWRIERDDQLIDAIVTRCREFYDSLTGDVPPDLDDAPATYELVRRLHPDIDQDGVTVLEPRLAVEFVAATASYDEADRRRRAAHTAVLAAMGNDRRAVYPAGDRPVVVARRQPNRTGVSFVPVTRRLDDLGV